MITVKIAKDGLINGFTITGHATTDCDDAEGRLVCTAVSSAMYMTVNAITEIVGASADISDDGYIFRLKVISKLNESQVLLEGFSLHISELAKQYKKRIKFMEVQTDAYH